jgi:hypothetical protein
MKGRFIMVTVKYDPTKPREMFNDLVSDEIQRQIAIAVVSQYKRAYQDCYENCEPAEAHDLLPHLRRAYIEGVMPDLAARVEGYTTITEKNKAENCWHRSILGDRIRLTQSKVEQREILPRNAEFRKGYARSNQMLFDFMNEKEVCEIHSEEPLYAIIVHMPAENDEGVPEFVDLIFPDKDYTEIGGRIRLLDKFPRTIPETIQEEAIPEKAEIKLQRSVKKTDRKTS